jgi:phage terminase large subunit-like protein
MSSELTSVLANLNHIERQRFLETLTLDELQVLKYDWEVWARKGQRWDDLWPNGIERPFSLVLAGRGWGKTRTAVEAVRRAVFEHNYRYISIVGATATDARQISIEGESGILNSFPAHQRPIYHPGANELDFPNGAKGFVYSADSPERLRGKQSDFFWLDELCAWERMRDSYDQVMFGCRLGSPRGIITTTPKPSDLLTELLQDPLYTVITGSTYDNQANLAPSFLQQIVKRYEGTRLGQQELYGLVLGDLTGALWNMDMFKYNDLGADELRDKMVRVVVGVDPAVSTNADSDETGIVVAGIDREDNYYVLEDVTDKYSPNEWRLAVINMYDKWEADMVVAEVNNGGDLIKNNLPKNLPYTAVRATRGKALRAEPVKCYYEQGKVYHRRGLVALEDEMCKWIPATSKKSPNHIDALAWCWTYLLGNEGRSMGLVAKRFTL